MPRAKTIRYHGVTINVAKVEQIYAVDDFDTGIQFEGFRIIVPVALGNYILAAWNRHHWMSQRHMDAMLDDPDKHYKQIIEELSKDGPYLKGTLIYESDGRGIKVTRVPK